MTSNREPSKLKVMMGEGWMLTLERSPGPDPKEPDPAHLADAVSALGKVLRGEAALDAASPQGSGSDQQDTKEQDLGLLGTATRADSQRPPSTPEDRDGL